MTRARLLAIPAVVSVLALGGCKERRPPRRDAGVTQRETDELRDAQDARMARIEQLRSGDRSRCDAASLVALVEIAGGTYPWNDAIARAAAHPLADELRRPVIGSLEPAVFHCLDPVRREAAHRLRRELDGMLARPQPLAALRALLDGGPDRRAAALGVLIWAPTHALRDDVGRLARGDDLSAWLAYLAILDLPVDYDVPAAWRAWIEGRRWEPSARGLDDLLAAAAGQPPASAPGARGVEIRRAAMQAARLRVRETPEPPPAAIDAIVLALASDPDPAVRRDAARLLDPRDPGHRARLGELAADGDDPILQLVARVALARIARQR